MHWAQDWANHDENAHILFLKTELNCNDCLGKLFSLNASWSERPNFWHDVSAGECIRRCTNLLTNLVRRGGVCKEYGII